MDRWIYLNSKVLKGVELINSVNLSKFNLLLHRLIASDKENPFTAEQFNRLSESLKLNSSDVQHLISTLSYILKQSNRVILKPTDLQDQLIQYLKFEKDKAEVFTKAWTEVTNKDFSLEDSKKVNDVSWQLNVQCASNLSREVVPNAQLQFSFDNNQELLLNLNEEDLLGMYSTLENIQNKLDSV